MYSGFTLAPWHVQNMQKVRVGFFLGGSRLSILTVAIDGPLYDKTPSKGLMSCETGYRSLFGRQISLYPGWPQWHVVNVG